jgi:hypothetical protein
MSREDLLRDAMPMSLDAHPMVKPDGYIKSNGGERFNANKPRLTLNPPEALIAASRVWAHGEAKYGRDNWRKAGEQLSLMAVSDSLMRHLAAFVSGEDIDEETGQAHVAHLLCNAMMLATFAEALAGRAGNVGEVVDDRIFIGQ